MKIGRLWIWFIAVLLAALIHNFLFFHIIVGIPVLEEKIKPEFYFLGPILSDGDFVLEGPADGGEKNRDALVVNGERVAKHGSQFQYPQIDKPLITQSRSAVMEKKSVKSIFPVDLKKSGELSDFSIPIQKYSPLKLEYP